MANTEVRGQSVPIQIPFEVFTPIFDHLSQSDAYQSTLYSACLVSRNWYHHAVERLYRRPLLDNDNFARFVDSMVPSPYKYSPPAELVRILDLSKLDDNTRAHDGHVHTEFLHDMPARITLVPYKTDILAAKILYGLTGLESFIAPRAGLMDHSIPALSSRRRLRVLDFSHSDETFHGPPFLRLLTQLPELVDVGMPKYCSDPLKWTGPKDVNWLQSLQSLHMGVMHMSYNSFRHVFAHAPSLTCLYVDSVQPRAGAEFYRFLECVSTHLLDLRLTVSIWSARHSASWDFLLHTCQRLQRLSVPAALIGDGFATRRADGPDHHPLQFLELYVPKWFRGGAGYSHEMSGWQALRALELRSTSKAFLRNLKTVRVPMSSHTWQNNMLNSLALRPQAWSGPPARVLWQKGPEELGEIFGEDDPDALTVILY